VKVRCPPALKVMRNNFRLSKHDMYRGMASRRGGVLGFLLISVDVRGSTVDPSLQCIVGFSFLLTPSITA